MSTLIIIIIIMIILLLLIIIHLVLTGTRCCRTHYKWSQKELANIYRKLLTENLDNH